MIAERLPWNRRKNRDAVDQHTESLFDDSIETDIVEERPELSGLFGIAGQLAGTLVPVEPKDEYVASLKDRLFEMQLAEIDKRQVWDERRTRAARLSRAVGIAVSIIAILALLARAVGSVLLIVKLVTGQRRNSVSTA